ncbi:hypothetical protein [Bathymodiolus japonicus methanotrophic gill symbiont]|uniref:hypothetical protein n=1 Tax=Bathymodiolus japonicus methanotrophic gill symbiont TaxID=113269 RepID=UPI001C8DD0A3|nr:hypothetical protein [Bathymodiolus japonicus methanotrophic gill symbiont]
MGDALVALRPSQMAGRLFGMQFLPPSRATSALRISELPCRLPGTKNHRNYSGSRYFCESLFWASQPKQAAKT